MSVVFPPGFLWGAATAALQIEGAAREDGRGLSVWDVFCRDHPERIFAAATPEIACDHYHRWAEDVDLMAELGLTSYRFSLSWPRLFPDGTGSPNQAGIDFYHRLIDRLLEKKIVPNVTLYHWDLPWTLAQAGGWENPECLSAFERYAEACFGWFGDRVSWWATLNEPAWTAFNGYLTGLHPPLQQDLTRALQVATNFLIAHLRVYRSFRQARQHGKLGLVCNLSPCYPLTESSADVRAAEIADGMLNRWFLNPLLLGGFPEDIREVYQARSCSPIVSPEDAKLIAAGGTDFLGVNYYYPHHVTADAAETRFHINNSGERSEGCLFSIKDLFRFVKKPGAAMTDWGWEIFPEGLYDLLVRLHQMTPDVPILVTENGIGLPDCLENGEINDSARISFVDAHLRQIHRAILAGARVQGYYLWSLMDNFSWINGYRKRYGLLYVDRETRRRLPKQSAAWFRGVASRNALE
jgi:6-phospho-beta-glucosidase